MRLSKNNILLLLAIMTLIVMFKDIVFFGKTIADQDAKLAFLPIETLYKTYQYHWQLPVWSPFLGFGHPVIGWGQLGFFIPVHLLLRFLNFSPVTIIALSPVIYTIIGLIGMYVFLKNRNFHTIASLAGSFIFALNGFMAGHLLHTNFHVVTMVLPILLWAINIFIINPTLNKSLCLAVLIGLLGENGQPQIVVFTFLITLFFSVGFLFQKISQPSVVARKFLKKFILLGLLALSLGIGLASIRVLPLLEFVPNTERSDGLNIEDVYDFSTPPWHGIALVIPRFFWNQEGYFGPKSFNETSSYVGIVPLLLSGIALIYWKNKKTEKVIAILLTFFGFAMALGKYSLIYKLAANWGLLSFFGGTSRFLYFGLTGICLLSALALDEITKHTWSRKKTFASFIFPIILLSPFFVKLIIDRNLILNFKTAYNIAASIEILASCLIFFIILLFIKNKKISTSIIFLLIAISLVYHHKDFYSLEPRSSLFPNQFSQVLEKFFEQNKLPGRVLSKREIKIEKVDTLPLSRIKSPTLNSTDKVQQQIEIKKDSFSCLIIPIEKSDDESSIKIEIKKEPNGKPLLSLVDEIQKSDKYPAPVFCFENYHVKPGNYWLSFSSGIAGHHIHLYEVPENRPEFQAIYSLDATQNKIFSDRPVRVLAEPVYAPTDDLDTLLLEPHFQVSGKSGSARWWGALANKNYLYFIDHFLGNSSGNMNSNKEDLIVRYRNILNMSGINFITQLINNDSIDKLPGLNFIEISQKEWNGHTVKLYQNTKAFPKAYAVPKGISVNSSKEAFKLMDDPNFDPSLVAFVEGKTDLPSNTKPESSKIKIEKYEDTLVKINSQTSSKAVVVLNDTTDPNWKAYVDGTLQPHLVANGIFRCVIVPEGIHTITFKYESRALNIGKSLSIMSFVLIILLFSVGIIFNKKIKV